MALTAEKMAVVLEEIYSNRQKPFILTQKEFEALSGKGKMRTKFLTTLDELLRKKGYVLIDLHKEMEVIGIAQVETIAQWDLPEMQDAVPESPLLFRHTPSHGVIE